jgi:2-polyprenyl-3-methyl-5-hydroxy-6-metoxy-1,4-benzoquinol methylase
MAQPETTAGLSAEEFEQHARHTVHFFSRRVPLRLREMILAQATPFHLLDVGCGDGQLVSALVANGLLPAGSSVTGVDISRVRLERFTALTGWPAVLADGGSLSALPCDHADVVVSTMVMEHVEDDAGYVRAIARVTRPGGFVFLTTVLRRPGAWYFRRSPDGRRVLDPTHVREYGSVAEVLQAVEGSGLLVREVGLERLVFPILAPVVRHWHARRPIHDVQRLFLRQPWAALEAIGLPIPRYREIQLVLQREQHEVAGR